MVKNSKWLFFPQRTSWHVTAEESTGVLMMAAFHLGVVHPVYMLVPDNFFRGDHPLSEPLTGALLLLFGAQPDLRCGLHSGICKEQNNIKWCNPNWSISIHQQNVLGEITFILKDSFYAYAYNTKSTLAQTIFWSHFMESLMRWNPKT